LTEGTSGTAASVRDHHREHAQPAIAHERHAVCIGSITPARARDKIATAPFVFL
jgi:hypothetical protein